METNDKNAPARAALLRLAVDMESARTYLISLISEGADAGRITRAQQDLWDAESRFTGGEAVYLASIH